MVSYDTIDGMYIEMQIYDIYQDIENELLSNIAAAFRDNINEIGSYEWQLEKLAMRGRLTRKNVEAIAIQSGRSYEAIEKAIFDSGYAVVSKNTHLLNDSVTVGNMDSMRKISRAYAVNSLDSMNFTNTQAITSADRLFKQVLNKTSIEVSTGHKSAQTALKDALKEIGKEGITHVTYDTAKGRTIKTPLDVAVKRNIRTTTANAAREMQFAKGKEWGATLIEISSHMGARPKCALVQGKIFFVGSGINDSGYPSLYDTSYGEPDGIFGINCRHMFYNFIKGISKPTYKEYDEKANAEAYKLSQQQRSIERNIRKWKREALTLDKAGIDNAFELGKVNEYQRVMRDFITETGRTRERNREQI